MKEVVINPMYIHLKEFVNSIDEKFDSEGELVYTKRNTVKRFFMSDGSKVIVKRYKHPNIVQQVGYTIYRPSKARRAFEFALRLKQLEIDTPEPIAYVEIRKWGVFTTGFFFAAENNDHSCKDLYDDSRSDLKPNEKRVLENDLVEFIAICHDKGFMHGDTNLSNFLYHKEKNHYHFAVIDINRSKFLNVPPTKEQCLDNLVRLTHEKKLLIRLVDRYALIRGWSQPACQEYVLKKLDRFEKKKKMLKPVK